MPIAPLWTHRYVIFPGVLAGHVFGPQRLARFRARHDQLRGELDAWRGETSGPAGGTGQRDQGVVPQADRLTPVGCSRFEIELGR